MLAAQSARLELRTIEDLIERRALSWDLERDYLAPLLAWGPGVDSFRDVEDLCGITPRILHLLGLDDRQA